MPKRTEYLSWAESACLYARSVIDECATEIDIPKEVIWDRYYKVNRVRFNLFSDRESVYRLAGIPDKNVYLWMKRLIRNVCYIRTGNCAEYAMLAFNYLRKVLTTGSKIEILSIAEGDHVFIVIGRSKDLQALARGEDDVAVICDPYQPREADRAYPAEEIKVRLRCFRDYTEANEPWPYKNEEFEFDPEIHTLQVYFAQEAVIDVGKSNREINSALQKIYLVLKNLDHRGSEEASDAYEKICRIADEISEYRRELNCAAARNDVDEYNVIRVQRYLNKQIRQSVYAAYDLIGGKILTQEIGEMLVLEMLLDDLSTGNNQGKNVNFVFKLVVHMSDDVLIGFLSLIVSKKLYHSIIYTRYDDLIYDENNLTLLTLVLKRRDGNIFSHLLSILPAEVIYHCLIKCADPFDRFFKWIEMYPDSDIIIGNVLSRLEDVLNPFEVKKICAISDEYHEAVMKNDVLSSKMTFVKKM